MVTPDRLRTRSSALLCATLSVLLLIPAQPVAAWQNPPAETVFRNVRVLDVVDGELSLPTNVLIRGNQIAAIGPSAVGSASATTIDGHGGALMPGLIDNHVHLAFSSMLLNDLYDPDTKPEQLEAAAAEGRQGDATPGVHRGARRRGTDFPSEAGNRCGQDSWSSHLALGRHHFADRWTRRFPRA